ncbi:transposase [Roseivivax halodurans JCM 10272]|uniref:Transposase n=1 Tax=Roseivivax halodurans JCM 10272 TaxID=1449350 RepID=X7EFN8_9RHOB|nr:transposase [Roseivivax halodurans JCM 10272]
MSSSRFSDAFKGDAVAQITERGYPVREVSGRLQVSPHSLYAWKKKFATASPGEAEKGSEIRRLKRERARVSEVRDILNRGGSGNGPGEPFPRRRAPPLSAIGPRTMASAYFVRDAK